MPIYLEIARKKWERQREKRKVEREMKLKRGKKLKRQKKKGFSETEKRGIKVQDPLILNFIG